MTAKNKLIIKNVQMQTNDMKYGTATALEQSSFGFFLSSGCEAMSHFDKLESVIDNIIICQASPVADLKSTIRARGNDRKLLFLVISDSPVLLSSFIFPKSFKGISYNIFI